MAQVGDAQIIARPVDTLDTPGRRPVNLARYLSVQNWNGRPTPEQGHRDNSIELSALERYGDTRYDKHGAKASLPFALINQRIADLRGRGSRVSQQDYDSVDDDGGRTTALVGSGQLHLDATVFPIMSRFDVITGHSGEFRAVWTTANPTPTTTADAGTFVAGDYTLTGVDLTPHLIHVTTQFSDAALKYNPTLVDQLVGRAARDLLSEEILEQILVGDATNEISGIAWNSNVPTRDIGAAATNFTLENLRRILEVFVEQDGDGGRAGTRDTILIASSELYTRARRASTNGVYAWMGGAIGRFCGEIDCFHFGPFVIPATTDAMSMTVAALTNEGLMLNADAVLVVFWSNGLDLQIVRSPGNAYSTYQLVAAVDATAISPDKNLLLARQTPS